MTPRLIRHVLGATLTTVVAVLALGSVAHAIDDPDHGKGETDPAECTDTPELQHDFDPVDASGWVRHVGEAPLCAPVYIHPTTWTFVNTSEGESIWPQNLQATVTLAVAVDGSKTYFQAPGRLECAQADIYYTGHNPEPGFGDQLTAPGHPNEPPQLYWDSDGPRPTWVVYGGTSGENGVLTQDCGQPDPDPEPVVSAFLSTYECGTDVTVNLSAEGGEAAFVILVDGEEVATPSIVGTTGIDVSIGTSDARIVVEGPDGSVLLDEVVVYEPCVLGIDEEALPTQPEPQPEPEGEIAGIGAEAAAGEQAGAATLPRTGGPAVLYALVATLALGLGAGLRLVGRRLG